MGRGACCVKEGMNRGAWSAEEDQILTNYIKIHGAGKWRSVSEKAGLKRCGKSCRLRWLNYLRPGLRRGDISMDEADLIIRLHRLLGNRWALIAGRLPGRTDNEIKNYWNTNLAKKLKDGQISHDPSSTLISETKKPVQDSDPDIPQVKIQSKSPEEEEDPILINKNVDYICNVDHITNPTPSFPAEDDGTLNFLMDFNVDEVLTTDVLIAGRLPGRTDNEIKNYWNTNLAKKLKDGQISHDPSSTLISEMKKPVQDSDPDIPQVKIQSKSPEEEEDPILNNKNVDYICNVGHITNPTPSFPAEDDGTLNFLMDFNVDEVLTTDVLSSKNLKLQNNDMHKNGNMVGGDNICAILSSDCHISGDNVSPENDMKCGPIQPTLELELKRMASFLDLEEEMEGILNSMN